jgi:hypothetical protein
MHGLVGLMTFGCAGVFIVVFVLIPRWLGW